MIVNGYGRMHASVVDAGRHSFRRMYKGPPERDSRQLSMLHWNRGSEEGVEPLKRGGSNICFVPGSTRCFILHEFNLQCSFALGMWWLLVADLVAFQHCTMMNRC